MMLDASCGTCRHKVEGMLCSLYPRWAEVSASHWCAQYAPEIEESSMPNLNVPIDEDLLERIRATAKEHDRSVAAEVRVALRAWLEEEPCD